MCWCDRNKPRFRQNQSCHKVIWQNCRTRGWSDHNDVWGMSPPLSRIVLNVFHDLAEVRAHVPERGLIFCGPAKLQTALATATGSFAPLLLGDACKTDNRLWTHLSYAAQWYVSLIQSTPEQCNIHTTTTKISPANFDTNLKILLIQYPTHCYSLQAYQYMQPHHHWFSRGADKSLARPTSRCILFDGENISFDASLVIYINSTNIPPIMIINRMYEHQNLLSL